MHESEGHEDRGRETRHQDAESEPYVPPRAEDIDTILSPAEVASGTEHPSRFS